MSGRQIIDYSLVANECIDDKLKSRKVGDEGGGGGGRELEVHFVEYGSSYGFESKLE